MAITTAFKAFSNNAVDKFSAIANGVNRVAAKVPTADVLTLGTYAELIPAPGAGKAIKVLGFETEVRTAGTAYATNTALNVITDTADQAQFTDAVVLTSTAARVVNGTQVAATGATNKQLIANKGVGLKSTGNPATGTFDIYVYIDYIVVDLGQL